MSGPDTPQMIFEALAKPGISERVVQRWLGRPFVPESFDYCGPPNAFIVDRVMLNYEIIARGILPEHLSELVAMIPTVEWATSLALHVRSLTSEARPFRAILLGRYIE
jgi:hypothetical protein